MFKERRNPTTKVEILKNSTPVVQIKTDALSKMQVYVEECKDEIGWLGTVLYDEKHNAYTIDDVFLFDQDVHSTTTEITPEGLSTFAEEILKGENGIEMWNNLKMWGHSHVNMGITPSGQDNTQMETFKDGGHDWFIRLIANKKGEMKIDIYNYKLGIIYNDVPWVERVNDEDLLVQRQINELFKVLEDSKERTLKKYEDVIKKEIKEKVNEIKYATGYSTGYNKGAYSNYFNKQYNKTHQASIYDKVDRKGYYETEDYFETDEEVYDVFDDTELYELSLNKNTKELNEDLMSYGYYNYFTTSDLETVLRVAKKIEDKYYGAY